LRRQAFAVAGVGFELVELALDLGAAGEHLGARRAVLAQQPLERRQARLHDVEPSRIGLDVIESMAHRAGELRQADAALLDLATPARGSRLVLADAVEQMRDVRPALERRALFVL